MKSLERLVLAYLKDITRPLLDPLQFAYRANRSVDESVNMGLHYILQHLDKPGLHLGLQYHHAWPSLRKTDTALCAHLHLSVDHQLPDRQAAASEAGQTHIQNSHHQHWRPSGLRSLPTALLTALQRIPLSSSWRLWTTLQSSASSKTESAYRQEVEQLAVWSSLNNLELNTLKTVEMIVDFRRNPPALATLTIMDSTVAAVETFRFLGTTISQDLKWDNHIDSNCEKGPAEAVFPLPAKEVQPATEAVGTVLVCHHRDCPVFIYNCLVSFSYQNRHQKTTTDSQDCWEDYRCPSAQPQRTLHLQSEEKG